MSSSSDRPSAPHPSAGTEEETASTDGQSDAPVEEASVEGKPRAAPTPIVGVGASAGGIDALQQFFRAVPAENGMAFVVVQHIGRDYESNLTSILSDATGMTVEEADDLTELRPDRVYVIQPGRRLEIQEGHLRVSDTSGAHEVSTIDRFFRSLASDQSDNAVGVLLSGTGTDGSLGLRFIKENGGVALVQSPEEAEYPGMPQSAISTGLVDLVLPVQELAEKLVEYRNSAGSIQLPKVIEDLDDDGRSTLQKIFTRLYTTTGHDFSNYKRSTVLRRLERRMHLSSLQSLEAYLDHLRENEQEIWTLYKDLLISVTSFFRIPEAFEALRDQVVPKLFEGKSAGDQVRVWVPGCATGEEAYSLAMLLMEYAEPLDNPPELQIFATDVDEEALNVGRQGLYPKAIESDISSDRLDRFFETEGEYYRVDPRLRDIILFAEHDLLSDPPFTDLDLVSCRNLLIYLDEEMQKHVFNLLRYGLRGSGYLFLGQSEARSRANRLFSAVDRSNNILQARTVPEERGERLSFPTKLKEGIDLEKLGSSRREVPQPPGTIEPETSEALHQRMLLHHVASILVNENNEIVHLSDRADRYVQFRAGTPTHDVLDAVPESVRPDLRSALYQASKKGKPTERRGLPVVIDGETRRVNLSVQPETSTDGTSFVLVRFDEEPHRSDEEAPGADEPRREPELEEELDRTREQLQTTTEEYEAATEEMEAATEELLSMNEELQSKNEELETSKEKLQSVNEELETTNQELKCKIDEVREANSVLENLMASTDIATIFLDRDLTIQRYTPRATELFNIQPSDVGRPLADFTQRFEYEGLLSDAQTVLDELKRMEREISQSEGLWFLVRLRPFRTVEDKIEGVVITFVDITKRRRLQQELVNATEKVRQQIGRDLHDMLSSDLAATAMKADNLRRELADEGSEKGEALGEIVDMIRTASEHARTLSHALIPEALQQNHLAAALEALCREQDELGDLTCTFDGDSDETLPNDMETAMHLYRIAHEALVNVRRHAGASQTWVSIGRSDGDLVLTVRDDGTGLTDEPEAVEGLGLRTMRYRATLIGASLSFESDDEGTVVCCALPLSEARVTDGSA